MSRPSLREIYGKDNNYNEIKTSELQKVDIEPIEHLAIKKLAVELRKKYTIEFIVTLLFNLIIAFLFYDSINSSSNIIIEELLLILIAFIVFFLVLIYIGIVLYSTLRGSYKKAQYGIIKTKYYKNDVNNNKVVRHYYVHVIFTSTNTMLREVRCNKIVYDSILEGSNVLVVSFDNRNAHIIAR